MRTQALRFRPLVVDLFAGGGGASEGIRRALGHGPDVAINHCAHAIEMHARNHPDALHLQTDIWDVDPRRDLPHGDIALVWASPSCTHFSRARGSKPVSKQLRGSAWVVARFAKHRRPKVIVLENVAEMTTWGPLGPDGQPLASKAGTTWRRFLSRLRTLGYVVEHRTLDAATYGAPTHRRRLFLVARRDGKPIVWPEPTHGPGRAQPYRTAASCIDWSLPIASIFDRKRPLAEATQRRIAEGIRRFVLDAKKPFILPATHGASAGRPDARTHAIDEPLRTIVTRGAPFHVIAPHLAHLTHGGRVHRIDEPARTITAAHRGEQVVVAPTLIQTGYGERKGQRPRALDLQEPLGTIVAGGAKHAVTATWLVKHNGKAIGQRPDAPADTITAKDTKRVGAAFLTRYYGTGVGQAVDTPLRTVTALGVKFALVVAWFERFLPGREPFVEIDGERYAIADIGMRMLTPRELARAQGFGDDYVLTGTKTQQVARVGNSVCPDIAAAIVRANLGAEALVA